MDMVEDTQAALAPPMTGVMGLWSSALASLDGAMRSFRSRPVHPTPADHQQVQKIRSFGATLTKLSDQQLRQRVAELRMGSPSHGKNVFEPCIVPTFSLVNEAARRSLGIEYFDVQLLAGLALARQSVAEMQTGEGKTLVAALPAVLFSLAGRGVHVMTANAYLAERDAAYLEPVFRILGITVGYLDAQASFEEKCTAYAQDVTYGPGYEFGFDYLRDQAALLAASERPGGAQFRRLLSGQDLREYQPRQRFRAYAIVDEIDSVLIDEANSPLILSEGGRQLAANGHVYQHARGVAEQLVSDEDYVVERPSKRVRLTARGLQRAEESLAQIKAGGLQRPWKTYIEQALRAQFLFQEGEHYVVRNDAVSLVDGATGRIFADRTLREGLHQAIEAKEQIPITAEQQPVARVSRQRYLGLYQGVCGMSGTTNGVESEFWDYYRLLVVLIPLRKASQRRVLPTRFFAHEAAKWKALVEDVRRIHYTGQPILVGTRTIITSQRLAMQFETEGIPFRLLNGVQDADEATLVAEAGQRGAVTIATNMAGRGTDIKLGSGVAAVGGLHVVVSEPHESTRVDRQLIGRCARQGDPGSCQMYASADDQLIKDHGVLLRNRLRKLASEHGEVSVDLTGDLIRLQARVERLSFAGRQRMFARDRWLDEVLSQLAKEG